MNYKKFASPSQVSHNKPIAIIGGTFDPIHNGHLQLAKTILEKTPCEHVQFLPCHLPVHRGPTQATAQQRREMIELAIAPYPQFSLNDSELKQNQPSYTINTLKHLPQPIYFCMGIDAFAKLSTWYQWEHLLYYCHLIIANRPGYTLEENTPEYLLLEQEKNHGRILMLNMPPMDISATLIRQKIQQGESLEQLLPLEVNDYIKQKKLYF